MNIKYLEYKLTGHIDSAVAAQATIDADVAAKLAAADAAFQTFVTAVGTLTSLSAFRLSYPSNSGQHVAVAKTTFVP